MSFEERRTSKRQQQQHQNLANIPASADIKDKGEQNQTLRNDNPVGYFYVQQCIFFDFLIKHNSLTLI